MRMKDKVVLVTGGAAGIGKATALRFAEEGAKVVICDVNEAVGQETLKQLGEGAAFYKVNVTSREDVQKWIDDVVAKYGRIDVIVNNAGVLRDGQMIKFKEGQLVGQMSEADFDLVISVNLKGVFNCAQAVAPVMAKQGGGVILNASSVVGLDANFGQTNYVATKFGVASGKPTRFAAWANPRKWQRPSPSCCRPRPASSPARYCRWTGATRRASPPTSRRCGAQR